MTSSAVPTPPSNPAPASRYAIPNVSQDLKSGWLNVARRLQSGARSKGISIVTIQVVVDADGEPAYWLSPTVRQVEPAGRAEEFLRLLANMKD